MMMKIITLIHISKKIISKMIMLMVQIMILLKMRKYTMIRAAVITVSVAAGIMLHLI